MQRPKPKGKELAESRQCHPGLGRRQVAARYRQGHGPMSLKGGRRPTKDLRLRRIGMALRCGCDGMSDWVEIWIGQGRDE